MPTFTRHRHPKGSSLPWLGGGLAAVVVAFVLSACAPGLHASDDPTAVSESSPTNAVESINPDDLFFPDPTQLIGLPEFPLPAGASLVVQVAPTGADGSLFLKWNVPDFGDAVRVYRTLKDGRWSVPSQFELPDVSRFALSDATGLYSAGEVRVSAGSPAEVALMLTRAATAGTSDRSMSPDATSLPTPEPDASLPAALPIGLVPTGAWIIDGGAVDGAVAVILGSHDPVDALVGFYSTEIVRAGFAAPTVSRYPEGVVLTFGTAVPWGVITIGPIGVDSEISVELHQ